jgi:hypothetical protein
MSNQTINVKPEPNTRKRVLLAIQVFFLLVIIVAGAILFMCLVGMIQFSDTLVLNQWIEISSQVLNAVFTMNTIVTHPRRIIRLFDILKVKRGHATEGGLCRLYESFPIFSWNEAIKLMSLKASVSTTILNICLLLQLNCLFQYPITVVMWHYPPATRPSIIVYTCLPFSFLCGLTAGIWQLVAIRKFKRDRTSEC